MESASLQSPASPPPSIAPLPSAVPAYDLRVSIQATEPAIWRRLLVPETITVPELHQVLQAAFGWDNRHLYGIRGVDRLGQSRMVIGPDAAAEDTDDEPASGVVLSELLDAQRDGPAALEYEYDFGDAWTHTFDVIGPAELPAGTLRCVDGANRGPVEDSGGPYGYVRLIAALADPADKDHQELSGWYTFATGQDAGTFDPRAFDPDALNDRLDGLAQRLWPEPPTRQEIDAVVRPVHWLLNQVPLDGLQLTQDGYLKPAVVSRAVRELGWEYRWPGTANREVQTPPVLRLRQQLQAWKLVRKLNGRLLLTPKGRTMHDGGRQLWDYLAGAVASPTEKATAVVTDSVVQWLVHGTTPPWDRRGPAIADALHAAGFRMKAGEPVPQDMADELYRQVRWTLDCVQLTVPDRDFSEARTLTDGGRKFLLQAQRRLTEE
ncbi:plasmid pRiA4b ORF-3 family protein [Arthrobacter sp. CG_A4]|uniref:plasmid pRiA4b ORF-3 family protein n=1 Tax=Arthrobacter sp. CG_A4 TaxID=3071706 RepID=UPI002E101160